MHDYLPFMPSDSRPDSSFSTFHSGDQPASRLLFPVCCAQLPYDQYDYDPAAAAIDTNPELARLSNDLDVLALQNLHRADLVMLIGRFPGTCGLG